MIDIPVPVTSSAKDALLFANTPTFLIRRIQSDPMVQYASQNIPSKDLFAFLKQRLFSSPSTPEDLIWAYVCLASLSVAADHALWAAVRHLPLSQIEWGREIYALLNAKRGDAFEAWMDDNVECKAFQPRSLQRLTFKGK